MDAIEFSDQDRKELIEHYSSKLKELESKAIHYQNLLNKLKGITEVSTRNPALTEALGEIVQNMEVRNKHFEDDKVSNPIPRQNWKQISLHALKEINSFSTTYDIYEYLILKSPEFIQYDKSDVISKISTALSNLYSKNAIKRIKNTLGRGYFWALSSWYSNDLFHIYKMKLLEKYGVDESTLFDPMEGFEEISNDFDDEQDPPF